MTLKNLNGENITIRERVSDCIKRIRIGTAEEIAEATGIKLVSVKATCSKLTSGLFIKRSVNSETGQTHYRWHSAKCPEDHEDLGFTMLKKRKERKSEHSDPQPQIIAIPEPAAAAPTRAYITLPGFGSVSIPEARCAYEALKEVFGGCEQR